MYNDEQNAKIQAEKAYYAQTQTNLRNAMAPGGPPYPEDACKEDRPSLRSEAEQQVGYHRSQAEKHDQAAAFFRENPVFDQFIRLVRNGAIQF